MRRFKTKKKRKEIIFKVILLAIISYLSFALNQHYASSLTLELKSQQHDDTSGMDQENLL